MAPRAQELPLEGDLAWLDVDSHLVRAPSGEWRMRCRLCIGDYKLPGGYTSPNAPTVAKVHALEMVRNIKKHYRDKHNCTFKASDTRYRGNEVAFPLIGTDPEVQAGFGNLKRRYRKTVKARLDALEAQVKANRATHDEWEARKADRLACEPEEILRAWGEEDPPQEDEDWDYATQGGLRNLMPPNRHELWDAHKGYQRLPQSLLTLLISWRDVLMEGYLREKAREGGADATLLREWRVRLQDYDDTIAGLVPIPVNVDLKREQSELISEVVRPLYEQRRRPLPSVDMLPETCRNDMERSLARVEKAYKPLDGAKRRAYDQYWDMLASDHSTFRRWFPAIGLKNFVHSREPPKPLSDADVKAERKNVLDAWIVECANKWLTLSAEEKDRYRGKRRKTDAKGKGPAPMLAAGAEEGSDHVSEVEFDLSELTELGSESDANYNVIANRERKFSG